ncbi:MAG: GNAT family N-acetyltransferase [Bacteroidota bacterium]
MPQTALAVTLADITIRTKLQVGDLPFVIQAHSNLYQKEYNYGKTFDYYVIKGVAEFYEIYTPERSCVWICEHNGQRIGFLSLMDRGKEAQLRYFFMNESYRGIGLGRHLMELFVDFLHTKGYQSCYLWTTTEQVAAARLYQKFGFRWVEDMPSNSTFDRPVMEQKYELVL